MEINLERIRTNVVTIDDSDLLKDLPMPTLSREFLNDPPQNRRNTGRNSGSRTSPGGSSGSRNSPAGPSEESGGADSTGGDGNLPDLDIELPAYNFLLE
jgi:hypothetical protein